MPEFLPSLYGLVMHVFSGKSFITHKKANPGSLQQDKIFMHMENEAKQPNVSKMLLKHEWQINSLIDELRDFKLKFDGQPKKLDEILKNVNVK